MKKFHYSIGIGLVGIASMLGILFNVQQTNATGEEDLVGEAAKAAEAYAAMNVQSQQQLVSTVSVQGMDIETALMMVQSERTKLLDTQLAEQLNAVQMRNDAIARLNNDLQELNMKLANLTEEENADEIKEIQNKITSLKSQMDDISNSQQMDMLRLQSLSNKRNEAFDLMTNFIKKQQDSRSSIIGNMR